MQKSAQAEPKTFTAPRPARPLVFMHIPKTGGHTLRAVLSEVYGDVLCPAQNWSEWQDIDVARYHVFIGHFGYDTIKPMFVSADFVTFLREPNERLLSLYHYLKATNQIDPTASLETYLHELAPRRGEIDQITRYLAPGGKAINGALETLRECRFVGRFEGFEAEIARLAHELEWSDVPPIPQLNTQDGERLSLDDLTPDERESLSFANSVDSVIYDHAVEQIWSKVE